MHILADFLPHPMKNEHWRKIDQWKIKELRRELKEA
jgi:hypothetical protein